MKNYLYMTIPFILVYTLTAVAKAAGGGHGAGLDEHTAQTIIYQAINVFAMFAGLVYFLRKPVVQHFKIKKEDFISAAQKADAAKAAAEEEHREIQKRLSKLETTADESISRAKAEAAELRRQMISEAESISKRLKEDAANTAKLEIEKAKQQIREVMIKEAVEVSRGQLATKVSTEDHNRLQGNFINNIQAGQQ